MAKDPVCGMMVDAAKAPGHYDYDGQRFSFCNLNCMVKFRAEPERYLHPEAAVAAPVAAGVEYTCPMHPEVVQAKPGTCPFCGMALEPKSFSAEAESEANPELAGMSRRFRISLWFTAPLFALAMAEMLPGFEMGPRWLAWVE